jgi:hypothetical protein
VLWTYAISAGADNPLVFYVAAILQFPGWLLFSRIFSSSIAVAEAAAVLVQVILLSIVIRKPWRRTTRKTA